MAGTSLITLTPLGKSLFRWFGDTSPLLRGPMTAMTSELVPLPTTVAGALYRAFGGKRISDGIDYERLHRELIRVMGCGEGTHVRGPYILIHASGEPGDWRAACFHNMGRGSGLVCAGRDGKVFSPNLRMVVRQSIGIALDSLRRAVVEGFIYTQTATDLRALAETIGEGLEASVAVEIGCEVDDSLLQRPLIPFGGDSHPARVRVTKAPLPTQGLRGRVAYFATPYLLGAEEAEELFMAVSIDPREAIKELAERVGVTEPNIRASAIIIGLAPTGYDTAKAGGVPRPTYPAIMPGSYITAGNGEQPTLPKPQPLGYGTIVTIPETLIKLMQG